VSARVHPSVSYSFTMRLRIEHRAGMLAKVLAAIAKQKGDPGAVDVVTSNPTFKVRDVTVSARDDAHARAIVEAVRKIKGVTVRHVSDRVFLLHLGGKIRIQNKVPVNTRDALSMAYTPGVARVCLAIAEDKRNASRLTIKHNSVAVVSDGSRVLGLGNIGPEAAMPVMEGKAMLFKEFADIDAYPNQINNVLAFPGLFRGALDARASDINEPMKLAAAKAIAGCITDNELSEDYIVPSVFNERVVRRVAQAVESAARASGTATRNRASRGLERLHLKGKA
jgi:malic enzyme